MYKSVSQIKRNITVFTDTQEKYIETHLCKVVLQETSTFMINFSLYSHVLRSFKLEVTPFYKKKKFKLICDLPPVLHRNTDSSKLNKGETKLDFFPKFKLQPNIYIFSLEFRLAKQDCIKEELNLLMNIGSVAECTFEKLTGRATQKARK